MRFQQGDPASSARTVSFSGPRSSPKPWRRRNGDMRGWRPARSGNGPWAKTGFRLRADGLCQVVRRPERHSP